MYSNLNPKHIGLTQFMKPEWKYDFMEILNVAEKYGWQGIDAPPGVFDTKEKAKEMGEIVSAKGMKWGLIPYPLDMFAVPDEQFVVGLNTLKEWAERAEAAGITRAYNHIWPGSDRLEYDCNFEWHLSRLNKIAEICNNYGIHYGLEFIGQKDERLNFKYDFIHNLTGALALADAADSRVGIVFDTIHWFSSGAKIDDLFYVCQHVDRIVNYHVNDAAKGITECDLQGCYERGLPMEFGVIDSAMVTKMLNKAGYDGPVMLEPMNPACNEWRDGGLAYAVSDSFRWISDLFALSGVTPGIKTNRK